MEDSFSAMHESTRLCNTSIVVTLDLRNTCGVLINNVYLFSCARYSLSFGLRNLRGLGGHGFEKALPHFLFEA
ncbi:hypothetical protein AWB77_01246 [Caballeronia fortuita]|uniref:Uncharacterized protein n=1 Tax=Caballeronia fortuita TaxID=1777138 RepID=A0A157ZY85_9BURK|nr:hypothetical protein AWB77_01246 [Caballeronia fortuita]